MFQVSEQSNWWLWDLVLLHSIRLDWFCETSYYEKWGELGNGFAIGDANTKNCPLKYLIC